MRTFIATTVLTRHLLATFVVCLCAGYVFVASASCAEPTTGHDGLVGWWRFDAVNSESLRERKPEMASDDENEVDLRMAYYAQDEVSEATDDLLGFHQVVAGVKGKALRLGGIGAYLVRSNAAMPKLVDGFSIEAWIALGAYSVNWCPIVAQANKENGFLFGIDAHGHLGVQAEIDGKWQKLVSNERIGLGQWAQIACTYRPGERLEIFLNGERVGELQISGDIKFAGDEDLLIGKHPVQHRPEGTIRNHGTKPVHTYFDGIVDELKIYNRPLGASQFASAYRSERPTSPPELPQRHLPAGPAGHTNFGAYYTTLKYYDAWDSQWRVGPTADVVVAFDRTPCRLVFWRGSSYVPHWVTENGIWYTNEFNETAGIHGCQEPMSDKQCRFSHVRIVESCDARVVVHWRYALVGNWYEFAHVDEVTGWGDWSDEIYTIYPDGTGVRKITLHSSNPNEHEWHEGIIVMGPGQRPDDVLETDAVTAVNEQGQFHNFSWLNGPPKSKREPPDANIQIINTKSTFKPFLAFQSESAPNFQIYDAEVRRDVSIFPWWNHWPTAFDACDGRYAMDADRASHSAITHCYWNAYEQTDDSMTKIMLNGVTNETPEKIARLTRSWDSPPKLSVVGEGFTSDGYDPAQRAYPINRTTAKADAKLELTIDASEQSPTTGLALVIANWNEPSAKISVDGQAAKVRLGTRPSLEGTDLIVWLDVEATEPLSITIEPTK